MSAIAIAITPCLPRTQVFEYEEEEPGQAMEFHLTYEGPLPSEKCEGKKATGPSRRAPEKHKLRKHFHKQLRELWTQHPDLRSFSKRRFIRYTTPPNLQSGPGPEAPVVQEDFADGPNSKTWVNHIADDYQRCGGRFVPLVRDDAGFSCGLQILFLRRDGDLIESGGDIDNRIKVLFDGLKMPKKVEELGGFSIEADEDPFFCLLEDDSLITKVSVTTDRLLDPLKAQEHIHDVRLVIHVTVVDHSAIFAGDRLI